MSKYEEEKWKDYYDWTNRIGSGLLTGEFELNMGTAIGGVLRLDYHRMTRSKVKPNLSPIQVLALSILKNGEDPATVAALLDEAQEVYRFEDVPVTAEWCQANGWTEYLGLFLNPGHEKGPIWVWIDPGPTREYGINNVKMEDYEGNTISRDANILKVVRLCNALCIPWTNKR